MVAGFVGGLAFLAIPIMFLMGAVEFIIWALDWIPGAIGIAMLACLVLIPLAIIPATRGLASTLFGLASFVFGACLWLYALAFTYLEWGMLGVVIRSEEHTSELQSLMRISYAVFCLKKNKKNSTIHGINHKQTTH